MSLTAGAKLGPYEIIAQLGAGGMGEVYRARDSRLGREVALKILPSDVANDPSRRQRFELEARAVAALNHPNIVAVYDVGDNYIVSELIQGETLRGASFGLRKTLDVAAQIADGLAAAHECGIVHRDLKPENILVTRKGRVKILDFGIAKLTSVPAPATTETQTVRTEPGMVMGTAGYMSPEQVRGLEADHRSDIFSFGLILHELLSGKRAFHGETSVETMAAILKQDPPELPESLPMSVRQIVTHCLEKDPVNRFQSARDLKFALAQAGTQSGTAPVVVEQRTRVHVGIWIGAAIVIVAAFAAVYWAAARRPAPAMSTRQLTFRRGRIQAARFAPDGRTVLYAAAWEGGDTELYSVRPEFPESQPLGLKQTGLFAISKTGEMAILGALRFQSGFTSIGTLAQVPLAGGAPRAMMDDVTAADWSADGNTFAVVRESQGRSRLEFPTGKLLYETTGWISHPRVSPKGDRIAFLDHPQRFDDRGEVAVVDSAGKKQILATGWESEQGLAWSPSGNEVWFSAVEQGPDLALHAVTLTGRQRLLARMPGAMMLQDVSADGRMLLILSQHMGMMFAATGGNAADRDLTLFNTTFPVDFTPDSKAILFFEGSEATGNNYATCLRGIDGSAAVKLGEGHAAALSPDGHWALTVIFTPPKLVMLPTGAGESRELPRGSIATYQTADWLPDGKSVVFAGNESGRGTRLYIQNVAGGLPRPISGEGVEFPFFTHPVAPDGRSVAARDADGNWKRFPVDGGEPQLLPGIGPNEDLVRWNKDGRSILVQRRGSVPVRVDQVDVPGGRRSLWKEIAPADRAGVITMNAVQVAPDGKTYAYGLSRQLDNLYVAEGIK